MPFALSASQRSEAEQRTEAMFSQGLLPPAVRHSNIKWWLTQPSYLKSHDWQLLAGMVGAYLLQGFLAREQEAAVFQCLHLFHKLLAKQFRRAELPALVAEAKAVIANMETVLPACESGILRHLVVHIAERSETAGPPWAHAMWAWERMWGTLVRWLKQKNHPATSIMNGYWAFAMARARCVKTWDMPWSCNEVPYRLCANALPCLLRWKCHFCYLHSVHQPAVLAAPKGVQPG